MNDKELREKILELTAEWSRRNHSGLRRAQLLIPPADAACGLQTSTLQSTLEYGVHSN